MKGSEENKNKVTLLSRLVRPEVWQSERHMDVNVGARDRRKDNVHYLRRTRTALGSRREYLFLTRHT